MLTVLSSDLEDDADQLEGQWGIPVALEMLHERLITLLDFLELCEEAADAADDSGRADSTRRSGMVPR